MYYCREIYKELGFSTWENFNFNVEKAIQLISSGTHEGEIKREYKYVKIGSGAQRKIVDYAVDDKALDLIKQVSYNKLYKSESVRNEVVILSLLKKYCENKNLIFCMQFRLGKYRYDACINESLLVEFDEQHHGKGKQRQIDLEKNVLAAESGFSILRIGVKDDIVDIILKIDKYFQM